MTAVTQEHATAEIGATLSAATIPWAAINDIHQVRELPALAGKFTTTRTPQGQTIRMQPPGVSLPGMRHEYPFPADTPSTRGACWRRPGLRTTKLLRSRGRDVVGSDARAAAGGIALAHYEETGT